MSDVTIFAPSPILTVTVEDHPDGSEIHVHPGGQGAWQARMLVGLGVRVTMCCVLSGEIGVVVRHLLEDQGIEVDAVEREGRGAAYLHDRRSGERREVAAEHGDPIGRHELDELYGTVLRRGLESDATILSGPSDEAALPADTYRRLAADLRAGGATVIADLAGERLTAVLDGGVDLLKVSDEELRTDGLAAADDLSSISRAMHELRSRGANAVIVTRAGEPFLLVDDDGVLEVTPPRLEVADHRGAGDSLLAGTVAGIVRGERPRDAITLGAAAGALNVTRHGLGTGDADTVASLRSRATTRVLDEHAGERAVSGRLTPEGLAALAAPRDEEE
ncbi:MAG TPA: PfkB family carbohydrate kinase [Microbacteriaceae bacterium]|nr:PfkB family carbohydrate kinase [Microbacteriaceae bacterium]